MPFVLDASAALPWCFQDEETLATRALMAMAAAGERIYVPAHCASEILNGATRAIRRGRLDAPAVSTFLSALCAYNIAVDARPIVEQWSDALVFIELYRLSAYDAAYLSLARKLNIGLATFDAALRLAAIAERVPLIV